MVSTSQTSRVYKCCRKTSTGRRCSPSDRRAQAFIRPAKNTDYNAISNLKAMTSQECPYRADEAVITISIHSKFKHNPSYLERASQHVFLSWHTLEDLAQTFPCASRELVRTNSTGNRPRPGHLICIEGLVYGDGRDEDDYASKFVEHLRKTGQDRDIQVAKAPTKTWETRLDDLTLRINEPCFILHEGNCEHYAVVDEIRMRHPRDPVVGYPITIRLMPILPTNCKACGNVQPLWSIVNDVRLGESPCLLCDPCWKAMGHPGDPNVFVVPLPVHVSGW
ncbi:snRNA-activating protein of 50kDa MW C terminal-domain-containing protein [Schizophyllum amplum]|uniref:snRNA-activating protein of 50kDa MW C terminal-domain-containing protein n=1 Tax=Schizophyllum amplum TaxID=97359 RepID=A0A550CXF5_9AGAR|nr:snRNA-activating protein of 50kDa MW C terminal-domain-containing protein [Auriculariopsis ampla]